MEGMFAGQTDPYPYIIAAYAIGFAALGGMPLWFIWLQKRYEKILRLAEDGTKRV